MLINILPDLRAPKIKASFFNKNKIPELDTSSKLKYEVSPDEEEDEEEEEVEFEPKLYEYVFLIDRSGSMSGQPIKLAVEALKLFLHSLPIGCKFNVVSFGSDYAKLFETSQPYNDLSFESALS